MEQKLAKTPENILKIANTYDDSERMFRKETRFSEREIFLLNYKMSQANTRNFSQYARIMCLSGLMITTDFSDL
ncbi:plasmid mobilization relaxosome protein MobC, partial [Enterococcus faecium]|nr:plasmid mobilization relaxosome protein MobC [Enterococcus faecium]